jgi:hypothetical protein
LAPLVDKDTTIIIGGDLNFRMDSNGTDQLNTILSSGLPYHLREMISGDKRLTCKFTTTTRGCRTRRMPTKGLRNFLATIQTECGAAGRIPSRCDRFLIGGLKKPHVLFQGVEVFLPESDHNGIYTCFDLS